MKIIFAALFIAALSVPVSAQKAPGNAELKILVGHWEGRTVATGFVDGKNQHNYGTALDVTDMQDSLMFRFTFTSENNIQSIEEYPLRIYENGEKLSFDSTQFDITGIERRGPRLVIYAERRGYENYKSVDFQDIFTIGPGILNITKGIKAVDADEYAIRKRITLTKR